MMTRQAVGRLQSNGEPERPLGGWRGYIGGLAESAPEEEAPQALPATAPLDFPALSSLSGGSPYVIDFLGGPQMDPTTIAAGIGRKTPRLSRPNPYSLGGSRGYVGGLMTQESPLSEPGGGGGGF